MSINELHSKILVAKSYLNKEMVKLRTNSDESNLNFREITDRLDMIHEVERIGYRNLNDREIRKVERMLNLLEIFTPSDN